MRRHCWPAYKRLLQRSPWPILVGPFRGEVGFEALYWTPFLHALHIDPQRLCVITRGGAHVWYPASGHPVELYDLRDPRDVRIENLVQQKRTGELKQRRVTAFDRAVLRDAAATLGLRRYHVLHPAWMYALLHSFWTMRRGTAGMEQSLEFTQLEPPPIPDGVTLPKDFLAVRFYLRHTFPRAEGPMTLARETIARLASRQPVVLLNPGVHADEHIDLAPGAVPNVFPLKDLCPGITPQNNLAIQSAVLGRAQAFVGTYGGLAQLALRYGRPSISWYEHWSGTAVAHKHLADALAVSVGVPQIVLRLGELALLHAALPEITLTQRQSSGAGQLGQIAREPATQAG